ncbi:MAG: carboxypeptidase-like regulatory domain-containing protein [Desulfurivibrionaceae bacterium]
MTVTRLSAILAVLLFLFADAAVLRAGENFVFRGRIVDTANEPVSGAEVYVFDSANVKRPADFISNRTGNDGYYRVELPAGHYRTMAIKRISAAKFGPLGKDDKHSGDPFEIDSAGKKEVIKDFTVMDLREAARAAQKRSDSVIRISGRVLDDSGRPLGMAYGLADPHRKFSGMPHYFSIWTERDGRYVLFLPRGKLFIGAARDFPPESADIDLREVEFTEDTEGFDLLVPGN